MQHQTFIKCSAQSVSLAYRPAKSLYLEYYGSFLNRNMKVNVVFLGMLCFLVDILVSKIVFCNTRFILVIFFTEKVQCEGIKLLKKESPRGNNRKVQMGDIGNG
jgi:hypothetical protein